MSVKIRLKSIIDIRKHKFILTNKHYKTFSHQIVKIKMKITVKNKSKTPSHPPIDIRKGHEIVAEVLIIDMSQPSASKIIFPYSLTTFVLTTRSLRA